MSDYFPGEITIGGSIPRRLLTGLAGEIENAGVAQGYGGVVVNAVLAREILEQQAADGGTAYFCNDQARFGQFEELEGWLTRHGIDFDRHSDARYEWDAENVYGRGRKAPVTVSSNTGGKDLADAEEIEVICWFAPGSDPQLAANCKLLCSWPGIPGKRAGWPQDPR